MATTFIDTTACERIKLPDGRGEVAEIVNGKLCNAKDVVAALRWLHAGDRFEAEPLKDTHQLIYLMDGSGVISLAGKDYDVAKGAGVYLGPSESAAIRAAQGASLKLLHLVVPHIPA
jgi:hypothetical protein